MTTLQEQFGDIDIYVFDQLLRGRITRGMRVFDAGCGSGRNIAYMLREGFDARGVDMNADAIAHVREMTTICAIKPRLRDYDIMVEALPMLADMAILDGCHQSNPRPCRREDLLELYRKSW